MNRLLLLAVLASAVTGCTASNVTRRNDEPESRTERAERITVTRLKTGGGTEAIVAKRSAR